MQFAVTLLSLASLGLRINSALAAAVPSVELIHRSEPSNSMVYGMHHKRHSYGPSDDEDLKKRHSYGPSDDEAAKEKRHSYSVSEDEALEKRHSYSVSEDEEN